jgi:5-methylcytosine-specific restriction endonuclease McrA
MRPVWLPVIAPRSDDRFPDNPHHDCFRKSRRDMSWEKIGDVAQTLFRCEHQNMRIVLTEFANDGSRYQRAQVRRYCDDCGRLVGSALKNSLATTDTPQLTREEATRPERLWREYAEQREAEKQRQEEQWRADYENYLLSPEWDDKRALVLKRAKGVCEGCGSAPASQVHHLTYANCGNEFLWELVAICRDCHRNVHGIEDGNE